MARLRFLPFALVLAAGLAQAEIRYSVQPVGDYKTLKVTVQFDAKAGPVELQMPNWAPGAYVLSYNGRRVQDFHWKDAGGNAVPFTHDADNSWKATLAKSGGTTVDYTVPCQFDAGALHFSCPSSYMYVVGRKLESCRLDLTLPQGWKVAVGLDAIGSSQTAYKAPNYDVLADNPVTAGDFIELRYTSHGKPVTIAMRGAERAKVDQAKVLRMCQAITDVEGDFFGGVPYHKFVWHFSVFPGTDGGGGLEHLSSTQIGLATGVGPVSARVCAHEFFHLWNVKRIRSRVLGPFDYTELPKTGALYWLEGVTDYYSSILITRSGYLPEADLTKDLINNLTAVRNNDARLEISPYESSMRVGEASGGRGNSGGWRISYYNLGWLVGLCLDVDLRTRTQGRRTLDDVTRALWDICKNDKPGFEEGEIEKQYVKFGGSKEFFERIVMKPGEMPIEEIVSRLGYKLEEGKLPRVDKGFDLTGNMGSPTVYIDSVRGAAKDAGLSNNDAVLEVNGKAVSGTSLQDNFTAVNSAFTALKAGDTIKLKVRHEGAEKEVTFAAKEAFTKTYNLTTVSDPSKDAFRKAWITGKRG